MIFASSYLDCQGNAPKVTFNSNSISTTIHLSRLPPGRSRSTEEIMANVAKTLALNLLLLCCASTAAFPAASDSTLNTQAVRTIGGYLMIVAVSIDGRGPYDFLVDTGTNTTLIDPALATELNLKAKGRLQLASLGSAADVPRYFLQTFKVGPVSVSNMEVLAVPLTQLTALDSSIRGILGMNFLLHFSFGLDYDRQTLTLFSPEATQAPAGLRVPVEINESRLLIRVESKAAHGGSWKLALDSGISQFLVFQDRIAPASGGPGSCGQEQCLMQVSTNLAEHSAATVSAYDVTIAEAQLPKTQIVVLRNDLLSPSDPQDGLLPAAPFHSVFFDRSTASIVFTPSPGAMALAALQAR